MITVFWGPVMTDPFVKAVDGAASAKLANLLLRPNDELDVVSWLDGNDLQTIKE